MNFFARLRKRSKTWERLASAEKRSYLRRLPLLKALFAREITRSVTTRGKYRAFASRSR